MIKSRGRMALVGAIVAGAAFTISIGAPYLRTGSRAPIHELSGERAGSRHGRPAPRVLAPADSARNLVARPEKVAEAEAEEIHAEHEEWERLYQDATLGQVIDEARALEGVIYRDARAYFDDIWENGGYEILGYQEGGRFSVPGEELYDINEIRFFKDGTVAKVTLPKNEYPQHYEMSRKLAFLKARIFTLEEVPVDQW